MALLPRLGTLLGEASASQKARKSLAKARSIYYCSACGFESPRWLGRCPQCEAWNSFDERPFTVAAGLQRGERPAARRRRADCVAEIGWSALARLRMECRSSMPYSAAARSREPHARRRPARRRQIDADAANRGAPGAREAKSFTSAARSRRRR